VGGWFWILHQTQVPPLFISHLHAAHTQIFLLFAVTSGRQHISSAPRNQRSSHSSRAFPACSVAHQRNERTDGSIAMLQGRFVPPQIVHMVLLSTSWDVGLNGGPLRCHSTAMLLRVPAATVPGRHMPCTCSFHAAHSPSSSSRLVACRSKLSIDFPLNLCLSGHTAPRVFSHISSFFEHSGH
jgi:hypothetical protein